MSYLVKIVDTNLKATSQDETNKRAQAKSKELELICQQLGYQMDTNTPKGGLVLIDPKKSMYSFSLKTNEEYSIVEKKLADNIKEFHGLYGSPSIGTYK